MTEPRQIAVVHSDDDITEICRLQAAALEVTFGAIDRYTGFTEQFWTKKLQHSASSVSGKRGSKRGWSAQAFEAALVAFCFDLVAVHNPEKEAKLRAWMIKHGEGKPDPRSPMRAVGRHPPIILRFSRQHMKKLAKKGGAARKRKLSPEQLSAIGAKAAKARWHKPKIVELSTTAAAQVESALLRDDFYVNARGRFAERKAATRHPSAAKRGPARRR